MQCCCRIRDRRPDFEHPKRKTRQRVVDPYGVPAYGAKGGVAIERVGCASFVQDVREKRSILKRLYIANKRIANASISIRVVACPQVVGIDLKLRSTAQVVRLRSPCLRHK